MFANRLVLSTLHGRACISLIALRYLRRISSEAADEYQIHMLVCEAQRYGEAVIWKRIVDS